VSHPATGKDMFDAWHGKKVLSMAPGLENLEILPFKVAAYDKTVGKMAFFDPSRADDFLFISGSKMRAAAAQDPPVLPADGFMAPTAWDVLVEYYASLKSQK
jgi:3'-phosphoadenosine 5'-phosphosulfate synthase